MRFRETYENLKLTVFQMENKQERENVINKFNRLSDDMDQYVIMSEMFPSLVIDANLPEEVINDELKKYAKVLVLEEHEIFKTDEELDAAIKNKIKEAMEQTYYKNRITNDVIKAKGNGFKIVYFDYEDTCYFQFKQVRTGMKKGGCNGYVVESEVVENPTLPPYSKAQRHILNKHYIEDTCILIEKAETEHNVFTGEKHTVQENLYCGYQSNDVKYKKTFIENEEILRIERKYAKKSANEELSFENLNKKVEEMEL